MVGLLHLEVQAVEQLRHRLARHVHQVVAESVARGEFVGARHHRIPGMQQRVPCEEIPRADRFRSVRLERGAERQRRLLPAVGIRMVRIDRMQQAAPGLFDAGRGLLGDIPQAVAVREIFPEERLPVDRSILPDVFEHQCKDKRILVDSLHRKSDALHVARRGGVQQSVGLFGHGVGGSAQTLPLSEVLEHAPDPVFPEKRPGTLPYGVVVGEQVEQQHPVVGDGFQQRLDPLLAPEVGLVIEQPRLHEPHGLRIDGCHAVVNHLRHGRKIFRVGNRGQVFVERVGRIEMVGAVRGDLFFEKQFCDRAEHLFRRVQQRHRRIVDPLGLADPDAGEFRLEARRHVPGEGGEHGRHAERTFAGEDELLKRLVPVDERLRQRASPAVQVAHPEPVEKRRAAEKSFQLLVCEPEVAVDLLPNRVLSRKGQRHVDTVERHEVDLLLPAGLVPPAD